MTNVCIRMIMFSLLFLFFWLSLYAQADESTITPISGENVTINEVHIWPGSKCDICHLSSNPDSGSDVLVNSDRSRLCESCHSGTVTILPSMRLRSYVFEMENHPIKFSPLDFNAEKINHNIIKEGGRFYVSGDKGKVPIFGATRETAVAECTTCHDPHGRSGLPKLLRIDNSKSGLCLACHLNY